MNSLEIENLLRVDCDLSTTYEGVFASDTLPSFCGSKSAVVMNFDPITEEGSHWVCAYVENGKGEYFDSYGTSPHLIPQFVYFMNRNCKSNWSFNRQELQSIDTNVCGHYCIWFLSERGRGKSMHDIVSQFSNDTRSNDVIVKECVERRFGEIAQTIVNRGSCIRLQCCRARK